MKPLINNEWMQWLSYEKDKDENAKLKENAPKEIKDQYENYLKHHKKYKESFFKDYK